MRKRVLLQAAICISLGSFVACGDDSKSGNIREVSGDSEVGSADTAVTAETVDSGSDTSVAPDTTVAPETVDTTVAPDTSGDTDDDTTVAPDTSGDSAADGDAGPTLLGDGAACTDASGDECQSGLCAPSRDGRVCVPACGLDDACPDRSFCGDLVTPKGTVDACLPIDTTSCAPCRTDDDCQPNGEPTVCIAFTRNLPDGSADASEGSFCVLPCAYGCAEDACFNGYCRPTDGEAEVACTCSPWAIAAQAESDCTLGNTLGACDGTRACGADGLGACDARTPTAEVCDGVDNDCDGGTDENCDDGNPCTTDRCEPGVGCKHDPATGPACNDNNACTATSSCFGGVCIGGTATNCDDQNPCTSLGCNPATGCTYAPLTGACDDNDPCTSGTTCTNGQCGGATAGNDCNDNNPCTADQCVPGFGCVHAPQSGAQCDDGNACTFDEVCVGATCTPQSTLDCSDINPCTLDSCTSDRQCSHVAAGASCVNAPDYQTFCEKVGAQNANEPNNEFTNAVLAASAQTFTTTIDPIGDLDRFVMWTCGERIVRVTLDTSPNISTAVDYEISYHPTVDSTRHTLRDGNGSDGLTNIAFNAYANTAGPVYVTVSDYFANDADPNKPYRLTMESLPVPDAALEPNDRRENATAVASGETTTAYIASLDDHDWFAIEVPGEKILRARLNAITANGTETDYEMAFYTADGDRVLTWRDGYGGDAPTYLDVNLYVNEATTMYVEVHDYFDDQFDYALPYNLVLDVLDVPDGGIEPNSSSTFAGSSLLATRIQENVAQAACIASVGDSDWFKLDVVGESIISVSVDNAPAISSPVDYEVTVYGPSGNALNTVRDGNGGDGTTLVTYNSYAFAPGTYYVSVHDYFDDEWDIQRCYNVSFDLLPVPDAVDEPNDIAAQATLIVTGTPHTAYIASLGDADWYVFAVPGEKIIVPRLSMVVGAVGPELVLRDSSDLLTLRDGNGGDNPTALIGAAYAPSAGNYQILVHDYFDDSWGYAQSYTLEVELHDVPDAAIEPNEIRANATPMTVGSTVTGYHASIRDVDFWSFTAPASGSVTLLLKTLVPTATDYEISLVDATGTSLHDARDGFGGDAPSEVGFTWPVTPGQTYYVRVHDYFDDEYDLAIPYTLTVQ